MKNEVKKNQFKTYSQNFYYMNRSEGNPMLKAEYAGVTFPTTALHVADSNTRYAAFEYIKQGRVFITHKGVTQVAREGDVYILKQGIDVEYYTDDDEHVEKLWFTMKGRLLDKLFEAYDLTEDVIISHCNVEDEIRKIHNLLHASTDSAEVTYKISLLIHEIIMKVSMAEQSADFCFNPGKPLADSLKGFIDSELHFDASLKIMAKHFRTTERYLIYAFKKKYGLTPYAYLLKKHLEAAKKMLINTELTVKEIAAKLSFSDSNYFSNTFKKHTGMSPVGYRRAKK